MISAHPNSGYRLIIWVLLAIVGVAFFAGVAAPWLKHQQDIDRCLDAGGAYDYESEVCVGARRN
jgi:hypothetical protein